MNQNLTRFNSFLTLLPTTVTELVTSTNYICHQHYLIYTSTKDACHSIYIYCHSFTLELWCDKPLYCTKMQTNTVNAGTIAVALPIPLNCYIGLNKTQSLISVGI